uniref:DNA polymerase n=1 Tax=Caenorhabditis tropicalis TaxID=1561998 RepID=A0A1I7T896_9PELO
MRMSFDSEKPPYLPTMLPNYIGTEEEINKDALYRLFLRLPREGRGTFRKWYANFMKQQALAKKALRENLDEVKIKVYE